MTKKLRMASSMFLKINFLVSLRSAYTKKFYFLASVILLLSTLNKPAAQINADGQQHGVDYTGSFQDLVIPNNPLITKIRFSLSGADGGAAKLNMGEYVPILGFETVGTYSSGGGNGAVVNCTFLIGTGPGKIPLGSTVRFIIGGKGQTGIDNIGIASNAGTGSEYGGGGGGTAVLFRAPGTTTFTLLGVAGGGGGAYQGVISNIAVGLGDNGGAGEQSENGANGHGLVGDYGTGGVGGNGGGRNVGVVAINPMGAGGGGRFTKGSGLLNYVDIIDITLDEQELEEAEFGEGGAGKPAGFDHGGYGGTKENQTSLVFATFSLKNGGFGYGGGGVAVGTGGGGGGYSGGGGGGFINGGGGGGSYLNGIRETGNVSGGGSDTEPDDGFAQYQVTLNHPPVANCKNATVYLNATGQASIISSDINNGSTDLDGDALTYSLSKSSFNCSNLGSNAVTLTVADIYGATATCTATVTVIDNTVPVITCSPNITVSCAADVAAANNTSVTVTDNCPVTITHEGDVITNQTCANKYTLTRTYKATDASGNSASCQQVITVNDDQAPIITNASTSLTSLWPASHKMKDVVVNYNVADNCATATTSLSVTSNEPINGTGDGDTGPDWEIVTNHLVKLRAERAGNGTGRIYTITIKANDGCNNTSTKTLTVVVNHSNAVTARPNEILVGETEVVSGLTINVQPNPSTQNFGLFVNSADANTAIHLRIYNSAGQVVETRNAVAGKWLSIGDRLAPGIYFTEVVQGKQREIIKLLKL